MLYLDNAATTPMRPEAADVFASFEAFGNPSGMHAASRAAKNSLEESRERAAELIGGAHPSEIVFTGGGSEADNLALIGSVLAQPGGVVTTAIEHKAVLEASDFCMRLGSSVTLVDPYDDGVVDPGDVADAVKDKTRIVSVMAVNNETGAVQPLADVASAVRSNRPDALIHTDAVQALLSEEVDVEGLDVDMLSLAAHKFGGPKGVGLLYVRRAVDVEPIVRGGSQEMGRRAGTQNPMGVAAMVAAMEATVADRASFRERVAAIRDRFETDLRERIPGLLVTAAGKRTPQHSHVRLPGTLSEDTLIMMDQAGLCAAAGSACQSGAIEVSHVLAAMGWNEQAAGEAVRFSFGWQSEPEDATSAAKIVADVWERARR